MVQIVTSRRQHINNLEKKRNSSLIALIAKKESAQSRQRSYLLFEDGLEVLRLALLTLLLAGLSFVRCLTAE